MTGLEWLDLGRIDPRIRCPGIVECNHGTKPLVPLFLHGIL